ncbi:MAG: metallophosphoesterase [Vicinamibacterales bacterium]|nr:metallophosphoesterase [Vicinamibacterales bacterium]
MTVTQPTRLARRRASVATWLLLVWVSLAWQPAPATAQPDRVVAIGDIHGAAGQFRALLETVGLTDSSQRWVGGRTTLVQTGDITDRGTGVKLVLDLLMRLESEASAAGGRVVVLLGNHEVNNLLANMSDVNPELLASFETPQSTTRREEAYESYVAFMAERAELLGPLLPEPLSQDAWMAAHPLGFLEYMDALGPDGTYGRWLMTKAVVAKVGDSILLHGGLHPTKSPSDLSDITEQAHDEIEAYHRYKEQLVDRGIILPFFTFEETNTAVQQELNYWIELVSPTGPPPPNVDAVSLSRSERELVDTMLEMGNMRSWSVISSDGPVMFRGFARWNEDEGPALARELTNRYGVARLVVGHSIPSSRLITSRFDNQVLLIDTGMLTSVYSGRPSALEIVGDRLTAVYLDRRIPLVDAPRP